MHKLKGATGELTKDGGVSKGYSTQLIQQNLFWAIECIFLKLSQQ